CGVLAPSTAWLVWTLGSAFSSIFCSKDAIKCFQPLENGLAIARLTPCKCSQSIKKTLSSECSVTHKKASSKRGNYLLELALILLLLNLFTNSIHIQIANLLDQILKSSRWQSTSLVKDLDAIAEDHQGRNCLNLQRTG